MVELLGTVAKARARIGGKWGWLGHCKHGAMPLVGMGARWIEGGEEERLACGLLAARWTRVH